MRKFNFNKLSWLDACQHLIAIIQDVSKRVDSVGSIENYGLDLIVITNNGELKQCIIYDSNGISGISCKYDLISNFDLPFISYPFSQQKNISGTTDSSLITKTKPLITDKHTFHVNYQIYGGEILSISPEPDSNSILIELESFSDGKLTLELDRNLIDSRLNQHDDKFFVLVDREEANFSETPTEKTRILTISFSKGAKSIEVIGTTIFTIEKSGVNEKIKQEFDPKKLHNIATQRGVPIVIQSDKTVYDYGSDMIVTIINPYFIPDEPIVLEIINEEQKIIFQKKIQVSADAKGIYQEIIGLEGTDWIKPNSRYTIRSSYKQKTAEIVIFSSGIDALIELDQKVYSWTDIVRISVIAPNLEQYQTFKTDRHINTIISTSQGTIKNYKLKETGSNTGIFSGEIQLTGFSGYDIFRDGTKIDRFGITEGTGPSDGKISCLNKDTITVTLLTPTKIVSGSAIIRWNIGEISWLESTLPANGEGTIRVTDPDMNLNPKKIDQFLVKVWSDTDPVGVKIKVIETGKDTGIFRGTIKFTTHEISNSTNLRVSEGDRITAEYVDRTLPEQYSLNNELTISATSMIGTLVPPLQRLELSNPRFLNNLGQSLSKITVNQEIYLVADLHNSQETEQRFSFIVEFSDEDGNALSTPSISGNLLPNRYISPSISWKPQSSGKFKVMIFVWESLDNPTALSAPIEIEFFVNNIEEDKLLTIPKKDEPKSTPSQQRFPSIPKVSIPEGTSVPGCEKCDQCYIPSEIIIRVNHTVVWNNDDSAAHTITNGTPIDGPSGEFDSGLLMSGVSFAHTFVKKGIYRYFCMVHPWQEGVVVVE